MRSGGVSLGLLTFNPLTDTWNNSGSFPPGLVGAYPSVQAIDVASQVDYLGHAFDSSHAGPSYLTTVLLHNFSQGPIVLLGASARGGAYDPFDGEMFVADSFTTALYGSEPDTIASFNGSGGPILSTTPIGFDGLGLSAGDAPESVAYDPVLNDLVVANGGTTVDSASLLNASTGAYLRTLSLPYLGPYPPLPNDSASGASEVLFDPVDNQLYFASPADGILGLYAGNLTQSYEVYPTSPDVPGQVYDIPYQTLALDPSTGLLYSVAPGYPGLRVDAPWETGINASLGWVLGGGGATFGSGIAFDPVDSTVYVSDPVADVLYVVNASSQFNAFTAEQIPVGRDPVAVAFDPQTDSILVANYGSSNVTVINGTTQRAGLTGATSIPVSAGPSGLIVDAAQDTVLVTSSLLGTVQAVSPAPALYSYTVGRASTDVGVPVSLEAVAIGGVGTLQYAYSGLPAGARARTVRSSRALPPPPGATPSFSP